MQSFFKNKIFVELNSKNHCFDVVFVTRTNPLFLSSPYRFVVNLSDDARLWNACRRLEIVVLRSYDCRSKYLGMTEKQAYLLLCNHFNMFYIL